MYLETLSELQDRLPSFPNEIAWAVVEEELNLEQHQVELGILHRLAHHKVIQVEEEQQDQVLQVMEQVVEVELQQQEQQEHLHLVEQVEQEHQIVFQTHQ